MQQQLEPRHLAARLKAERQRRGWSLEVLAARSGVSRAMISKIERNQASPTAALLGRLAGAFETTLSLLLAEEIAAPAPAGGLTRADHQPIWRDPATGYVRRAITPPGAEPELVRVRLPPGQRVPFPASSYAHLRGQAVWVLEGKLEFTEGSAVHLLGPGDCLALGPPADCVFRNPSANRPSVYLVALSRYSGARPSP
jgi:transcriptional regulator with XRE-family HTH domain